MINRQKVDTTPAIGMPFDSVFEMQKTSGSSNRPVFKLVLLPGERNLMKSDERDVQGKLQCITSSHQHVLQSVL